MPGPIYGPGFFPRPEYPSFLIESNESKESKMYSTPSFGS